MNFPRLNILLADDDEDDCLLFREALEGLELPLDLKVVNDGERLMKRLNNNIEEVPHVLFLDLNMPRKNGFECLNEIKANNKLKELPVIIYSTSFDTQIVNQLYQNGAHHYVRKPAEFNKLKTIIHQTLTQIVQQNFATPAKEEFILQY